jgi:hypothetical protein
VHATRQNHAQAKFLIVHRLVGQINSLILRECPFMRSVVRNRTQWGQATAGRR